MRSLILIFALATSAVLVARVDRYEVPAARSSFSEFPMRVGEWRGRQEPPLDDTILRILGVDDYLTRTYFANRAGVGLYVGYWASQRQGDTIHSPLNCLPGAGWEPESQTIIPAPFSTGTFPVSGFTFIVLLIGTVLLIGALNFLPALTLGPIVEHFLTLQGKLF